MPQNFSKMSEIYIPELIELDSYWQKAVEDAIYDTLKGEKRLHYALRNRKKINRKLKNLGLKRVHLKKKNFRKSTSKTKNRSNFQGCTSCTPSVCESETSVDSKQGEQDPSGLPDRNSHSNVRSRSGSKGNKEQKPDKKYKSPERPLLGDGSLEKMKKSQNSFNLEPMGAEEDLYSFFSGPDLEDDCMEDVSDLNRSKNIKWLHVREDSAFDESDTEVSNEGNFNYIEKYIKTDNVGHKGVCKTVIEQNGFVKEPTLKDKNYFMNQKISYDLIDARQMSQPGTSKDDDQKTTHSQDNMWENEVKNAIRQNTMHERRLRLALAKREVLKDNLKGLKLMESNNKIQVNESQVRSYSKKKKSTKILSPFIKFYLNVYKELCHKCPVKDITAEAANRWWALALKQKTRYSSKKFKNK